MRKSAAGLDSDVQTNDAAARWLRKHDPKPTRAEVMAARSQKGGWTKEQLAKWGVSWPPPKGWLRELVGEPPKEQRSREAIKKRKPFMTEEQRKRFWLAKQQLEVKGG